MGKQKSSIKYPEEQRAHPYAAKVVSDQLTEVEKPAKSSKPKFKKQGDSNDELKIVPIPKLITNNARRPLTGKAAKVLVECPAVELFIGPSKSGKTTTWLNAVFNPNMRGPTDLVTNEGGMFSRVYILSDTAKMDRQFDFVRNLSWVTIEKYSKGLLDSILEAQENMPRDQVQPICIIIDDTKLTTAMADFVKKPRHWDVFYFAISGHTATNGLPDTRKNVGGLHLYKSDNAKEKAAAAEEWGVGFGGASNFIKLWNQCCQEKGDFMFVNFIKGEIRRNYGKLVYKQRSDDDLPVEVRNYMNEHED